jgi:hypothetical protein
MDSALTSFYRNNSSRINNNLSPVTKWIFKIEQHAIHGHRPRADTSSHSARAE